MTSDEWETISLLIDQGWPGDFTDAQAAAWRVFLNDYDAEPVLAAIKALVAKGGAFRPSIAEVVAQIRCDPARPTFDEALTLWRTALRAFNRPLPGSYSGEAQMIRARHDNVMAAAMEMHPLIPSFIARHGIRRLQDEVGELDGEYGAVRRVELEQAWLAHVNAFDGRDVAALTAPRGARGLAAFDPLAALDGYPRRQLGAGTGA